MLHMGIGLWVPHSFLLLIAGLLVFLSIEKGKPLGLLQAHMAWYESMGSEAQGFPFVFIVDYTSGAPYIHLEFTTS